MFDSYINYRLCEVLQRKHKVTFPPLPSFGDWRFPKSLLWMLAFALALPFLAEGDDWRLWPMLEYNLKFIVSVFFFLQGLSLVWWGLSKEGVNRFFPLPLRVALIIFLSIPLYTLVAALGFGDICLDFRTRRIKGA
jgi:uncharacterized protein YybS (DUF2232 family)